MKAIVDLIRKDPIRLEALECVCQLELPQCYIAAGFVRNLVWDSLHHNVTLTPLNDIDVIFFDADCLDSDYEKLLELKLSEQMPQLNWQVKNQAKMHLQNGDNPYQSTLDAMSYWPEKETAVAVRKVENDRYECISAFGFESLFQGFITHNPKRAYGTFENRVKSKGWLAMWPNLRIAQ
ncbi:nitrate reductase [Vibrio cholerae]|uniref:nucleotidyltransferase family protein n=1 Tax=Vibrio cholerae TaxID=666 RepID=UPI001A9D5727|nr:nucleotidyltransferase family protein [Vibrio cholerae]MBO1405475.1 nitrate reductase [Vibrio cholerae]WOQ95312.1 nucleotidyltransferase family protein [Vibrio cholerae]